MKYGESYSFQNYKKIDTNRIRISSTFSVLRPFSVCGIRRMPQKRSCVFSIFFVLRALYFELFTSTHLLRLLYFDILSNLQKYRSKYIFGRSKVWPKNSKYGLGPNKVQVEAKSVGRCREKMEDMKIVEVQKMSIS